MGYLGRNRAIIIIIINNNFLAIAPWQDDLLFSIIWNKATCETLSEELTHYSNNNLISLLLMIKLLYFVSLACLKQVEPLSEDQNHYNNNLQDKPVDHWSMARLPYLQSLTSSEIIQVRHLVKIRCARLDLTCYLALNWSKVTCEI